MSNEMRERGKRGSRRPYQLKARARHKEDVRRRITEAAVHLHETVGPARTTMNAIAELAGVQRATVYNHFPTEVELIDACSSHWFTENPPPDQTLWTQSGDPVQRTERALLEMYHYYEHGRDMLERVLRDSAVVPAMDEIRRQKWLPLLNGIVETLAQGWSSSRRGARPTLLAGLMVALDFFTWETLVATGLSTRSAAKLAAAWVEVAAGASR